MDRTWRPRAALTAGPGPSRGAPAGWGAGAWAGPGAGGTGDTWTAVAAGAPKPAQQEDAAGASSNSRGATGGGLRSGWTVIGKKKAAAVAAPGEGISTTGHGAQPGARESSPQPSRTSYLGLADDAWEA